MRIYNSPIKLLGEAVNPKEIDKASIRKKRKELLLRFNLTPDTTLQIAGKEYDKHSLIQAFETFEEDIDFHVMLSKYPAFVDFLENGDTAYFENPDERGWHLVEIPAIKNKIQPYFIDQYNETLYQLISSKDFRESNRAKRLLERPFPIPEDWKGACFLKTHDWFEHQIKELKKLSIDENLVSKKGSKWRLHESIFPILQYEFINKFKLMPITFDGLKQHFAEVIQTIASHAFSKEDTLNYFDRETLHAIKDLSHFAFDQTKIPAFYQNAQVIDRLLNAPERPSFYMNADLKRALIILVLFLLVFTIFKRIFMS